MLLHAKDVDINLQCSKRKCTPLFIIIDNVTKENIEQQFDKFEQLLQLEPNVAIQPSNGDIILFEMLKIKSLSTKLQPRFLKLLHKLFELGCNVNETSMHYYDTNKVTSLLQLATKNNQNYFIELLLKNNADIHVKCFMTGETMFQICIIWSAIHRNDNQLEIIKLYLKYGGDINFPSAMGITLPFVINQLRAT